ncbi:hypothetical protein [Maritimibacter dapengensis]|uniref:PH domain-containing protein n=1 Tax=Maritimibacter dapengensis TaxID=2836868 RepID=A0ABS6T0F4_9RHOB|nr:hypothetical protein [Maritimibacter dapengensis]MBV7378584.1 hypothetical protein [Maritimibacter dapengensis]
MSDVVEIHTAPPNMWGMRFSGIVFLGIFALWAIALIGTPAHELFSLMGFFASLPLVVGLVLTYVGFTGTHMRRRIARIDETGAQVGVHEHLGWDKVSRIERRGSGQTDTLILFSDERRVLRRPIPVGRAERSADDLVMAILAHAEKAGLKLAKDGERALWTVTNYRRDMSPTGPGHVPA